LKWNIPLRKKRLCFELHKFAVAEGELVDGARISVLILWVLRRKVPVRIRIDGCGWGQGLEHWALLMASGIYIIIYSSTRLVISHGLYDRSGTSKNVHII
jgi:hypothetical protein